MIVGCSGSETQLSLARRTLTDFEFGRCCLRVSPPTTFIACDRSCDAMRWLIARSGQIARCSSRNAPLPPYPTTSLSHSLSVSSHLPPPSLKDRRPSLSRRIVFYLEPIWGGRFYSPARCASPTPSLVALWPRTGVPPRAPSAPENGWSEQYSKRRRKNATFSARNFAVTGSLFKEILVS